MKLPDTAWLQYAIAPGENGVSLLTQTTFYEPRGLMGLLNWYVFSIPHRFIFPGMLKELGRRVEALEADAARDMRTEA